MSGGSWTHAMARPVVRPMLGTAIRPNHLTALRLLAGLGACGCVASGTPLGLAWGGGLWLVSAFLDRVDGELARLGNLASPGGHVFDYCCDIGVNSLFFLAAGVGTRASLLGAWAVLLGLVAGACLCAASVLAILIERRSKPGVPAYGGRFGFHPDDALYLLGPFTWAGWLPWVVVASALCTPPIVAVTAIRLWRLARRK